MANYPSSAPSFSAKTPGQTIASAHINALQDEVVAIGGGLLNGTAPLNSSNSTLARLSAGNSTISNLTVTNCTVASLVASVGIQGTLTGSLNANSTNLVVANIATATSGSSGGASALPATPSGFIKVTLNGSTFVIPYYNP